MNKRFFNMVEILLAMLVISFGFVAVVGLLPSGLEVTRDAQENTYVTMAADTIHNYIRGEAERYDLSRWKHDNPNFPGMNGMGNKMSYYAVASGYITQIRNEINKGIALPGPLPFDDCRFSTQLIPDRFAPNFPSTFQMLKGASKDKAKYHYMKWITDVNGEDVIDFDCIAVAGLSFTRNPCFSANGVQIQEGEGTVYLSVRVEWPAKKKPSERKFREFVYYVF